MLLKIRKKDLIKRVDMLQSYINTDDFILRNSDLFESLGCFDDLCRIECKSECVPVVQHPRRIPIKLKEKLKATLDNLKTRQVISNVDKPGNWVSNLVVLEKKDEKLCGKSMFSVLDLKEGF